MAVVERLDWFRAKRMNPGERARWDAEDAGRVVRMLRENHGWTRSRLAEVAGLAEMDVAEFEAGRRLDSQPMLVQLTRAMGHGA